MSDVTPAAPRTKRILITLDTSARGQAALQAAVQLASSIRAELQGMFVEDEDLVRLAQLPFACEVEFTSAMTRPILASVMERDLKSAAQRTQQAFARVLEQKNLSWTFHVVRGTMAQATFAAAADADMLVIGQQGRALQMSSAGMLPARRSRTSRVVVVFDGSESSFRAIELAHTLADSNQSLLCVLVLDFQDGEHSQRCSTWLKQNGVRADVDVLIDPSEHLILGYVRARLPGALVINRDSKCLNEDQLAEIVNQCDCPVILC
jgi:nucleotide-binding universal stress UspA family protein